MIAITPEEIDIAAMMRDAIHPKAGGMVIFVGTVRDDGMEALDCESFDEVALRDLEDIAEKAKKQFLLCSVDIVHRTGRLAVTEPIVVIIVTAPHREDAYSGSRFIIEKIKEYVPIWKKEICGTTGKWIH